MLSKFCGRPDPAAGAHLSGYPARPAKLEKERHLADPRLAPAHHHAKMLPGAKGQKCKHGQGRRWATAPTQEVGAAEASVVQQPEVGVHHR